MSYNEREGSENAGKEGWVKRKELVTRKQLFFTPIIY
jgi:hypothetical protein